MLKLRAIPLKPQLPRILEGETFSAFVPATSVGNTTLPSRDELAAAENILEYKWPSSPKSPSE